MRNDALTSGPRSPLSGWFHLLSQWLRRRFLRPVPLFTAAAAGALAFGVLAGVLHGQLMLRHSGNTGLVAQLDQKQANIAAIVERAEVSLARSERTFAGLESKAEQSFAGQSMSLPKQQSLMPARPEKPTVVVARTTKAREPMPPVERAVRPRAPIGEALLPQDVAVAVIPPGIARKKTVTAALIPNAQTPDGSEPGLIAPLNTDSLKRQFAALEFDLSEIRVGKRAVPRIYLAGFPRDLPKLRSVSDRKALFFKAMLPLILRANEEIRSQRRRMSMVFARQLEGDVRGEDNRFLADLAEAYDLEKVDRKALLRRVDVVPPSLALAQAAEESGWGTSRFAHKGNAVYGQRTTTSNKAMVPTRRKGGQKIFVRSFGGIYESVLSYMRNLNTHRAYRELRVIRAKLRRSRQPLDGRILAQSLTRYSERGRGYIRTINTIIRANRLHQLDDAKLSPEEIAKNSRKSREQRS